MAPFAQKVKRIFGSKKDVTVGEIVTKLVTDTAFLSGKWKLFAFHLGIESAYIIQVQQIIDVNRDYVTAFWKLLDVYVSARGSGALVTNIVDALEEHRLIQLKEQIELLGNGRLVSEQYKPFVPATPDTSNRSFDLGVVSTQLEQLTTDENASSLDDTIVVNNIQELGKDEDIAKDFLHKHHKMSNLKILKAKRIGKSNNNPFAFNKKNNTTPRPLAISLAPQQGKPALLMGCIIETLNSSAITKGMGARVSKYFKKNNPSLTQGPGRNFGNVLQPTPVQPVGYPQMQNWIEPTPQVHGIHHNRRAGVNYCQSVQQNHYPNNPQTRRYAQPQEHYNRGNNENQHSFGPQSPTYFSQSQHCTYFYQQPGTYFPEYVQPNKSSQNPHCYVDVPNESVDTAAGWSSQRWRGPHANFSTN